MPTIMAPFKILGQPILPRRQSTWKLQTLTMGANTGKITFGKLTLSTKAERMCTQWPRKPTWVITLWKCIHMFTKDVYNLPMEDWIFYGTFMQRNNKCNIQCNYNQNNATELRPNIIVLLITVNGLNRPIRRRFQISS